MTKNKQSSITILKQEYKQRASDGKWMELSLTPDLENVYRYKDENNKERKLTPTKWIITNIFDYMLAFEENLQFVR